MADLGYQTDFSEDYCNQTDDIDDDDDSQENKTIDLDSSLGNCLDLIEIILNCMHAKKERNNIGINNGSWRKSCCSCTVLHKSTQEERRLIPNDKLNFPQLVPCAVQISWKAGVSMLITTACAPPAPRSGQRFARGAESVSTMMTMRGITKFLCAKVVTTAAIPAATAAAG